MPRPHFSAPFDNSRCTVRTSIGGIYSIRTNREKHHFDNMAKLKAYRATVPVGALPVYRDIFSVNVEIALFNFGAHP